MKFFWVIRVESKDFPDVVLLLYHRFRSVDFIASSVEVARNKSYCYNGKNNP